MAVTVSSSGPRGAKTWEVRWKGGEYYGSADTAYAAKRLAAQARAEEKRYYSKYNPSRRRNLSKLQQKVRAAKKATDRRVATALAKYLRAQNPGAKLAGAKVQKLKGGVLKITPVKMNRRRR